MQGRGAVSIPKYLERAIEVCYSKGFLIDLVCDLARKELGEDATPEQIANWLDKQSIPVYFMIDQKPNRSVIGEIKKQLKASALYLEKCMQEKR
ncbi:hypothetical protein EBZ39_02995 [bacterium]|nr:hypothetical protein [bacterium]